MGQTAGDEGQKTERSDPLSASAAYNGDSSCIGDARHLATRFLTEVQAVHGLPVLERAMGTTQLVVSELVTNAVKYASGPVMLDLQISEGAVRVSVWDGDPVLPDVAATDPQRVGRHGLEITLAVSQAYEVRREPVGKRVTAVIALADDPGGDIAGLTAPRRARPDAVTDMQEGRDRHAGRTRPGHTRQMPSTPSVLAAQVRHVLSQAGFYLVA